MNLKEQTKNEILFFTSIGIISQLKISYTSIWARSVIMRSFPCVGLCMCVWRCYKKTDIYHWVHAAVLILLSPFLPDIYLSLSVSLAIPLSLSIPLWTMYVSLSVCLFAWHLFMFSVILSYHKLMVMVYTYENKEYENWIHI